MIIIIIIILTCVTENVQLMPLSLPFKQNLSTLNTCSDASFIDIVVGQKLFIKLDL